MPSTDANDARGADPADQPGEPQPGEAGEAGEAEQAPLFLDAATRVSNPSAFDDWYYGIEDKLGQGTVGMGICLLLFIAILVVATLFSPI